MSDNKHYTLPRDVFMHLLTIITLYISAISFGSILFNYINRFFPDPLEFNQYLNTSSLRWSIAALFVTFPVYFFLTRFLNREYLDRGATGEPRIRKWLIYLTLFAAALAIIIDLVALISKYLGGEITVRFILKVLIVLFIAASIFRYYFWELNFKKTKQITILVIVVGAAVVAAIIAGFVLVGSPKTERLRKFDERRVNDLQFLQSEVINYWINEKKLPNALEQMEIKTPGLVLPKDPEVNGLYEYSILSPLKFELCAEFKTALTPENNRLPKPAAIPYFYPEGTRVLPTDWNHEVGRKCFSYAINPDLYKNNSQSPRP